MSVKQEAVNGAFSRDSFSQRSFLTLLLLTDWMEYTHTYFQRTVFSGDCKSWYKRGLARAYAFPNVARIISLTLCLTAPAGGPVVGLWPGSVLMAIETLDNPRWEDWTYTTNSGNRFGWCGNGWSQTELAGGDTGASPQHSFPAQSRGSPIPLTLTASQPIISTTSTILLFPFSAYLGPVALRLRVVTTFPLPLSAQLDDALL